MSQDKQEDRKQPAARPEFGTWEEADGRVRLIATRCRSCGETFFPARGLCLRCRSEAMDEVKLAGPARLTTFTVIHPVPAGFASPLVAGYARFEEDVSVFAPIEADPASLKPGATQFDVCVGPIRRYENGESLIAYKFLPCARQASHPSA